MKTLKRCRKATIYDDAANLLCQASVFLDEEENLMISVPEDFDERMQETFEVIFFDPVMGLLPCRCALSDPQFISDQMTAFKCLVHERGEQIQRRNDIKVPIDVDIVMHTDGVIGGEVEIVEGGFAGKMKDISAGGTYIVSSAWINAGQLIDFVFPETKTPVMLKVEVLRVVELTDDEGHITYGHGCRFVDLSNNEESQIRNFVFRIERELYKNDIW